MDVVAPFYRPNLHGVLTCSAAKQQSAQTRMSKWATNPAMSEAGLLTECLREKLMSFEVDCCTDFQINLGVFAAFLLGVMVMSTNA